MKTTWILTINYTDGRSITTRHESSKEAHEKVEDLVKEINGVVKWHTPMVGVRIGLCHSWEDEPRFATAFICVV